MMPSSASPTSNVSTFSTLRARSYVFRLPLFTRIIICAIVLIWALSVLTYKIWDLKSWWALAPDELSLAKLHRLSSYPFVHLNFFHMVMNVLALTPLLERFESEYGTLTSLALFFGPLTTLPGILYVAIEKGILRGNTPVMGASVWVFLLLGIEAIRTFKTNPYLTIGTHNIPTWTMPLILVLCIAALVPSSSLPGHLCGLVVGYGCGLGYLKFLAPPEKALRWIEGKLNLLGRLPHYVSVDQKTYGRFGVLPTSHAGGGPGIAMGFAGTGPTGQRLGP